MKVSTVIAALQQEDPDSEIMIQWFTKSHVEFNTSEEYTNEHWEMAVALFDKWDIGMDEFDVRGCLSDAQERLGAK